MQPLRGIGFGPLENAIQQQLGRLAAHSVGVLPHRRQRREEIDREGEVGIANHRDVIRNVQLLRRITPVGHDCMQDIGKRAGVGMSARSMSPAIDCPAVKFCCK